MIRKFLLRLLEKEIKYVVQEEIFQNNCRREQEKRDIELSTAVTWWARENKLVLPENCTVSAMRGWFYDQASRKVIEEFGKREVLP